MFFACFWLAYAGSVSGNELSDFEKDLTEKNNNNSGGATTTRETNDTGSSNACCSCIMDTTFDLFFSFVHYSVKRNKNFSYHKYPYYKSADLLQTKKETGKRYYIESGAYFLYNLDDLGENIYGSHEYVYLKYLSQFAVHIEHSALIGESTLHFIGLNPAALDFIKRAYLNFSIFAGAKILKGQDTNGAFNMGLKFDAFPGGNILFRIQYNTAFFSRILNELQVGGEYFIGRFDIQMGYKLFASPNYTLNNIYSGVSVWF